MDIQCNAEDVTSIRQVPEEYKGMWGTIIKRILDDEAVPCYYPEDMNWICSIGNT